MQGHQVTRAHWARTKRIKEEREKTRGRRKENASLCAPHLGHAFNKIRLFQQQPLEVITLRLQLANGSARLLLPLTKKGVEWRQGSL